MYYISIPKHEYISTPGWQGQGGRRSQDQLAGISSSTVMAGIARGQVGELVVSCTVMHPILERRSTVLLLLLLLLLRHAQGTPPGFRNGVDWRALVKDLSPQMAKLREHFFLAIFLIS